MNNKTIIIAIILTLMPGSPVGPESPGNPMGPYGKISELKPSAALHDINKKKSLI